ncbi:aldehyde dehydrogenase family protein [Sphingobacterium sp. E70]|nr:aldehyde dehydrogenase family protein [Sphingobacterium sp. E70]ULT22525.1 aldehyde dehydrogenase family protein [Sphingobacterium sp. E70]
MSAIKRPSFKERYDNYIGGKFVALIQGKYFDNISPVDGKVYTQVAHSTKEDLDLAVDTASKAFETWGKHQQPNAALSSIKLQTASRLIWNILLQ